MSSVLRSLRKRLSANPPPVKPKGKLYAGDIKSVSIGGREFPVLESATYAEHPRSVTVFKGRSTGATVCALGPEEEYRFAMLCPDIERRDSIEEFCRRVGETTPWSYREMRGRVVAALMKGWGGATLEELEAFEVRETFPGLFT